MHEIGFWRRNPIPYIFGSFIFALTMITMWGMAAEEMSGPNLTIQNSASRISYLTNFINQLVIFMLPSIVGASIYRDYGSRMQVILFSYPFTKYQYLLAKFASSFLIVIILSSLIGLGFAVGVEMPNVNPDAVIPFSWVTHLKLYMLFVWPNLFIISVFIFTIVGLSRNIYIGFITAILINIFNIAIGSLPENIGAFADPFGTKAIQSITKFWTLSDRNQLSIPISGIIIWNRLLWLSFGIICGFVMLSKFQLSQFANIKPSKKSIKPLLHDHKAIKPNTHIQRTRLNFDPISKIRLVWNLSNVDFKYIVFSWPFLAIVLAGGFLVFIQQKGMVPQNGVAMLPTTSEMLRIPMFIFSGPFNLLTFLFTGILVFRDRAVGMQDLTASTLQPNWIFLITKMLAILKMQLVLLTLALLSGVIIQTLHGYYRYEFLHYFFELYILNLIHFFIWACMAFFVHSLFQNIYLSFLTTILIPIGVLLLPDIGETLNMPLFKEHFLQFNHVPNMFMGFKYSDFNQYGSALPVYFFYKLYWSLGAFIFILLSLLFWKRGYTYSWQERWQKIKLRLDWQMGIVLISSMIVFFIMGTNVYLQENKVSKTFYSDADEDRFLANNELCYGHLADHPQPRLAKANLTMDLFPDKRNFLLTGTLSFVNLLDTPIDTILVGTSFKEAVKVHLKTPSRLINEDIEMKYLTFLLDKPLQQGDSLHMHIEIKNYRNSLLHDNSRVLTDGTYITNKVLPSLGVRQTFLTDSSKRAKFGLPPRKDKALTPSDSSLLGDSFNSNNMQNIEFETLVTTSGDQIAFSLGELIDSGNLMGRNFFHYKSNGHIKSNIAWLSGHYEKYTTTFGQRTLNIYHHPKHKQNLKYLSEGAMDGIAYCEKWFSPLQHEELSMIEFPLSLGSFATLNGNLIPFSESIMLCDIDDKKNEEFNHPYFVAAHEIAHYWWGHKVDPANVNGGKLITESMAEYISKRAIEDQFGKKVIRENRAKAHAVYFDMRAKLSDEVPLRYASPDQDYLNYVKGGLVLTSLSSYIGEAKFNGALAQFEQSNLDNKPPYPTSLEFIETIRRVVPDTLEYLIEDLFETITIYDNRLLSAKQNDGILHLKLDVRKFRANAVGRKTEVKDFNDFVKVGIIAENSEEETTYMIKVKSGLNEIKLETKKKVSKVILDPDVLLLDPNKEDQTIEISQ